MARLLQNRNRRRFRCPKDIDKPTCHDILAGVWHLDWHQDSTHQSVPPNPYIEHWANCVIKADDVDLKLDDRNIAISLVDILKTNLDTKWSRLQCRVRELYALDEHGKLQLNDSRTQSALRFALELWLHVSTVEMSNNEETLRQSMQACLPNYKSPKDIRGRLNEDFSAKNLQRRGGIDVVWTDRIEQHLTILKGHSICVFRHCSMLRGFDVTAVQDPYPPGFAKETLQTLYLLFRPLEPKYARRNNRYMEKHAEVDLELAMAQHAIFDLARFPFWHERLAEIQALYDQKTPRGFKQWWFDRRNRVQWATFWLAFLVLLLTIIFGLIQSVTGVLQVVAAYQAKTVDGDPAFSK